MRFIKALVFAFSLRFAACIPDPIEVKEVSCSDEQETDGNTADTDASTEVDDTDSTTEPAEELRPIALEIRPVEAFLYPQDFLDSNPYHGGEEASMASDVFYSGEQAFIDVEGLVYHVDIDGAGTAEDYLHWCTLYEVHGGGTESVDVIPVDISSEIVDDYVYFDYSSTVDVNQTFIFVCSFEQTDIEVGLSAALVEVVNPTVTYTGGPVDVAYTGTNRSEVTRTVYLAPND